MRIATLYQFDSSIGNLQRRQQALTESQIQLTSGKRILRASDDPTDAARAERAATAEARAVSQQRALAAARNSLALGEGALAEGGELAQQAREVMVAAGNASYSDNERRIQAETLRGLRTDLLSVANRADGAGRWLFGGQGSGGPPLVDGPGGVAYVGTPGQQQGGLGATLPLALDGQATWLQAPDPANPGATVSIFDALDEAIAELSTPGRTSTEVAGTVSRGIARLDATIGNLSSARARVGEALNRAEALDGRLAQAKLDAQTEKSAAEDLDMLAAISDFQNRQTGYDAALKTYSTVQRMSLFDYIE